MTTRRVIVWFLGASLGLVVVVYLALIAIHVRDRSPSAYAVRLGETLASRSPIEDDDNAYIYLLGFSAGRDDDPRAQGKARVAWLREATERPFVDSSIEFPWNDENPSACDEPFIQELLNRCRTVDADCLESIEGNEARISDWVNSNAWLLGRYQTLLKHGTWVEFLPYDLRVPLPRYSDVLDAQVMLHAKTWLAAGRADTSTVRRLLTSDLRFWRMVLASSDLLITKMIAVTAINRHFGWSGLILHRLPPDVVKDAVPSSWLVPLSDDERSMLRAMTGEWQFGSRSVRQSMEEGLNPLEGYGEDASLLSRLLWGLAQPLLRPQDYSNRYAELVVETNQALNGPYESYAQDIAHAKAIWRKNTETGSPVHLYDPIGRWLFDMTDWDVTSYAVRVADLEGARRLVLASADIRSHSTPLEKVPDALSISRWRDPYTGAPFAWDDSTKTLVFQGFEGGEWGRHTVPY